jgi:hypothetical protein
VVGQIDAGVLDVGYVDAGPSDGAAVLLLRGWPYSGAYSHRTIEGGIGHNLPQEAPEALAAAVIDLAREEI